MNTKCKITIMLLDYNYWRINVIYTLITKLQNVEQELHHNLFVGYIL